jgi:hypothetical protein
LIVHIEPAVRTGIERHMNPPKDTAALEGLIDTYCAVWSEPDPVRRQQTLDGIWAENATYTDPRAHLTGSKALCAHIGNILASRPGARIMRTSVLDFHHGLVRFAWQVVQADGTLLPEGLDIAEISNGMKLLRIIGFFGPLAPNR